MSAKKQDVTAAELEVLEVLWELGPSTIRVISDRLRPSGGTSAYGTVQKLLGRLEGKRCVRRRRAAAAHVFAAAVDRQELVGRRIQAITERLCGGSVAPVITHLVQNSRLSAEDRAALRALIGEDRVRRGGRGS